MNRKKLVEFAVVPPSWGDGGRHDEQNGRDGVVIGNHLFLTYITVDICERQARAEHVVAIDDNIDPDSDVK